MCGIAGIIDRPMTLQSHKDTVALQANRSNEMQHLLSAMLHRGPDAMDMRHCSNSVLLGSNRLRITDAKNVQADMPITTADGRLTIVFNGEVYNHLDIRAEIFIERPGYSFKTMSDTETILAAFDVWGQEGIERFEGMFAFAIYDAESKLTHLASDPTGQKTIYIHRGPDGIAFASEIDALISDRQREKHWDKDGLQEYVSQRLIVGNQTHIAEIKKVNPGTIVTINQNGDSNISRFYKVPIGDQTRDDVDAITTDIQQAVVNGVQRTTHLEVQHALLLSGGIDSTSVLSCLSKEGVYPYTYSTGFDLVSGSTSDYNTAETDPKPKEDYHFARELASDYGTVHDTHLLPVSEYCDYLDKWADYCGEPLGSQEAPCLIKLLEGVSKGGSKIVFTGSGPDEIFDGYSYGKRMEGQTNLENLPSEYANTFHWSGDVDLSRLMPNSRWKQNLITKYQGMLDAYKDFPLSVLQATQLMHFHGRLVSYECRQMDVISMRHSVEARAPLLDKKIVESAFSFSPSLKQHGSEKGIFKQSLRSIVPDKIIDRKKGAFPVPEKIWFSDEFSKRAGILFDQDAHIVKYGIVDKDYMKHIWEMPTIGARNIFSRLYTLEKIMRRQSSYLSSSTL